MREAKIDFIDDGPGKPVGINKFIGRRPIAAFGNSDGDFQMLEWVTSGTGPHTAFSSTTTTQYASTPTTANPPLANSIAALMKGPNAAGPIVSMKSDWKRIFPFDQTEAAPAIATQVEPELVGAAY